MHSPDRKLESLRRTRSPSRLLKIFGCPHAGCSFSGIVSNTVDTNTLHPPPSAPASAGAGSGGGGSAGGGSGPRSASFAFTAANKETLRNQAISLLSRLHWYDRAQFKRFVAALAASREISFLMGFLHGYLGFCVEPQPASCASPNVASESNHGFGFFSLPRSHRERMKAS